MIYMICSSWDKEFDRLKLIIMSHFLPFFFPPKTLKNQNFEKMRKIAGYIIILHICTKNHNHRRYGFWDTEWDRQKFLSFWSIVWSFTPLLIPKIKIWKKCKKHLEILSFYTSVPQMTNIWCTVPEIWSATDQFFLSFWTIFCPFIPLTNQKMKILKKWKKLTEILSSYTCVP